MIFLTVCPILFFYSIFLFYCLFYGLLFWGFAFFPPFLLFSLCLELTDSYPLLIHPILFSLVAVFEI